MRICKKRKRVYKGLSRGFTLLEVLVSLGLVSIVLAAIGATIKIAIQQQQVVTRVSALSDMVRDIRTLVMSPDQCSSSIAGISLKSTVSQSLDALNQVDSAGVVTKLYEKNQKYDQWMLDDIQLVIDAEIQEGLFLGKLALSVHSEVGGEDSASTIRTIPLHIETDPNKIVTKCLGLADSKPELSVIDFNEICNVYSKGTDQYDQGVNACKSVYQFSTFSGTAVAAQCAPKWEFDRCTFSFASDTSPTKTSAIFPNGSSLEYGPPPVVTKADGAGGCTCVSAIGVVGTTCKVICKKLNIL
jgi:prepilin-type N-terminal cleavage/methylation domain-containing protein